MDKNESISPTSYLILSKIVAKRGWAHPFGGQRHGARADFLNQTPIMGDSDDAAGIFRKQFADDGTGKRGEIARRFIQKQDLLCCTKSSCKKNPLLLPSGKFAIALICQILDHHFFHGSLGNHFFLFVIKRSPSTTTLASR